MLIIDSKDCENIDKALKKYKKKFEKSRTFIRASRSPVFHKAICKKAWSGFESCL